MDRFVALMRLNVGSGRRNNSGPAYPTFIYLSLLPTVGQTNTAGIRNDAPLTSRSRCQPELKPSVRLSLLHGVKYAIGEEGKRWIVSNERPSSS